MSISCCGKVAPLLAFETDLRALRRSAIGSADGTTDGAGLAKRGANGGGRRQSSESKASVKHKESLPLPAGKAIETVEEQFTRCGESSTDMMSPRRCRHRCLSADGQTAAAQGQDKQRQDFPGHNRVAGHHKREVPADDGAIEDQCQ